MLVVVHPRALVAVERRLFIVQNFFLDGQKVVSVVVVRKLVAGCGLLGVGMRVVAIQPGPSVQTAVLCVATAVVEERSSP